jgi:hypothetical protein
LEANGQMLVIEFQNILRANLGDFRMWMQVLCMFMVGRVCSEEKRKFSEMICCIVASNNAQVRSRMFIVHPSAWRSEIITHTFTQLTQICSNWING